MRLLVFSAKYLPVIGGVEVFLANLLPALAARGNEVEVVTSVAHDAPVVEEVDGVGVRRLPLEGALLRHDLRAALASRRAVAQLRKAFRPDVIHVHDVGAAAWLELRTRRDAPAPVVLTVHNSREQLRGEGGADTALGAMLRHADRVVAVSQAVARDVTELEPALSHEIEVIPTAVPVPVDVPGPAAGDAGARLLMLGRFTHQKGFDVGLRAFALLAAASGDLGFEVAGVGPEEESLRRLAGALGIADRVVWRGALRGAEVTRAYDRATLLVMPSRSEGHPLVALEAASRGKVVVGTRVGGLDEAVIDGLTGVLVPVDDAAALAAAIGGLLADPARIAEMGRAARQRVAAAFSIDDCVVAHEALYRSLVRR